MALKISLYTLLANTVSLDEAIKLSADAGFDAVDIRQKDDGKHIMPDISDADAAAIRTQVEDAGMVVSGLTTYWEIGKVDPDAAQVELDSLRRSMDTAKVLGAGLVRVSSGDYDREHSYEECRAAFREQFARVGELAAEMDLVITPEQHPGRYTSSAGQCLDMCRGLEHPNLGLVFDPGNTMSEGFERPWVQVRMLGPWIRNVHVKNRWNIEGEPRSHERLAAKDVMADAGVLDWDEIADELAAVGYDGYLTCEDFAKFDSLEEKFAWNVAFLRGLASKFG